MSNAVHSAGVRPTALGNVGPVAIAVLFALVSVSGCQNFLQRKTGDLMGSYAEEHMVPYMMASGDQGMACETGVSMGAFLMSFERVTDPPRRAALVTLLAAGMCAEATAWEADLRQSRAVREGRATEARDARIAEKRSHTLAAGRFFSAYQQLEGIFGTIGEGCPDEFEEDDEILFLLGLSAGMLAVVHDRAAEGAAEVPMDIPQAVARAAACLDSDRWWGAPMALQASVWASVPGAAPEDADPWAALEDASAVGEANGVRLARAFQVQILEASGQDAELKDAIAAHVASYDETPSHPDWELLDSYATRMILHVSDRIWTTERGHRTPFGALGTFWQPPQETEGQDELFDDLFGAPGDDAADEAPDVTPSATEENTP